MTIDSHGALALLQPLNEVVDVSDVTLTLDEGWSPYAQASLVCALPDAALRDLIDLRSTDIYLDLRLRQDFGRPMAVSDLTAVVTGDVSDMTAYVAGRPLSAITNIFYRPWNGASVRATRGQSFTLLVTERTLDDVAGTLTIRAESLEALLLGDALVSAAPLDPGSTSIKVIVQSVLTRYGLTLSADSEDATVAQVDATIWQPGITAWAYLDAMLEAASLRLWANEFGTFRIDVRQSTTAGAVTIIPSGTMTAHRDTMTRDPKVWFDAVVVEYRWVDDFDLNQVAYDVAGTEPASSVLRLERAQTRYPGAGAAAGILDRGAGRGRVLDVEAVSDYTVAPGMPASITPPVGDTQTGYISAVTFRLPGAEMSVETRGLVDTPPTAYIYGAPGKTYLAVPVGIDYTEFDWSMV